MGLWSAVGDAPLIICSLCTNDVCSADRQSTIEQANSPDHVAAINRARRIIKQFDVLHADRAIAGSDPEVVARFKFDFIDSNTQIDAVAWDWSEGNALPFPSRSAPGFNSAGFKKWSAEGTDIVRIFLEETKKRGLAGDAGHRSGLAGFPPGPETICHGREFSGGRTERLGRNRRR